MTYIEITTEQTVTEIVIMTEMAEISRTEITETTTEMTTDVISEEMTEETILRQNQFRIRTESQEKTRFVRTDRSVIRRITKMAEERARMERELTFQNL